MRRTAREQEGWSGILRRRERAAHFARRQVQGWGDTRHGGPRAGGRAVRRGQQPHACPTLAMAAGVEKAGGGPAE